jgi:hypothetical protein
MQQKTPLVTITVLLLFVLFVTLPIHGVENPAQSEQLNAVDENSSNLAVFKPEVFAPNWLTYLNYIRSLANLGPVIEDLNLSRGIVEHARYMVKNNVIKHDQDPSRPYFTREGQEAARNSNIIASQAADLNFKKNIEAWITCAFHGLCIIDPMLQRSGYGDYTEQRRRGFQAGGGLDVLRGRERLSESFQYPVMWPADGKVTHLTSYIGNEWPDPIIGSGFIAPTGAPVYLLLGNGTVRPSVTSSSFQLDGRELPHITIDETNYRNPDRKSQDVARIVMRTRSAIILIPQHPLIPGRKYDVSITSNDMTYAWSFQVAENATPPGR